MNPFKYGCIVNGDFFCQRPVLERELRRLIESGQNVVIQGERRMGKTSLVCEAVRKTHGVKLLYVDLMGVKSVADFCRKVTVAVTALDRRRGFLSKTADLLRRLRPTLTIDTTTGAPTLSVDFEAASAPDSLEDVLNMVAHHARSNRLCVVFDEFQDMLNVENAQSILATMRGKIQFQPNTPYIFLGSVRNEMSAMFSSPRSPFYKSAALFDIGRIDDADFKTFLTRRFKAGGRIVSDEILNRVLDIADRVSGDVQELCDALWASTENGVGISESDIPIALDLVFARESKAYTPIIAGLTAIQMRVLRGIARLGGRQTLSKDFLRQTGIANAGSVRKSILRMVELDILYSHEGEYKLSNPFFGAWLLRN